MSLALVSVGMVGETKAGVVIGGTRVVFPGASRDIAVRIENKGQEPALVQAWIDDGDARSAPENAHAPFAITPPVFRIDPGRGHALRIVHIGEHPPSDREALYWLNVLEIPPSPEEGAAANTLQFAFRHRLKLLHRPSDLAIEPAGAPGLLTWSVERVGAQFQLRVVNPTPYVISFNEVAISTSDTASKAVSLGGGMALAKSQTSWPWPKGMSPTAAAAVTFATINDYGAVISAAAKVTAAAVADD